VSQQLAVLAPVAVLAAGLLTFSYVELARRPARTLPKPLWALVILASIPFGAILYLILGRGEREAAHESDVDTPLPVVTPEEPADEGLAVRTLALSKVFTGGVGLHGVELNVPARGVYGLVGPNGAGKTTLLSLLAGLRRADTGEIVTGGRIMLCPDTPAIEPWLTATETVELVRSDNARQGDSRAGEISVEQALALVGLRDARDRRVGGFSRGMAQRLGIAVILTSGAEVLLFDEPTSALDPQGRSDMLSLLTRLGRARAVVVSSHILGDVQRIADTVGVLREGRLLYEGPVRDLIERHTRPSWRLELRSRVDELAQRLRREEWVVAVEMEDRGLRVDTTSLHAGEVLLPAVVAATGAELVAFNAVGADLETVFLGMVR
jgi:ABC-2 type transport system ATP-binding protein